jgi:hypothetical protein
VVAVLMDLRVWIWMIKFNNYYLFINIKMAKSKKYSRKGSRKMSRKVSRKRSPIKRKVHSRKASRKISRKTKQKKSSHYRMRDYGDYSFIKQED